MVGPLAAQMQNVSLLENDFSRIQFYSFIEKKFLDKEGYDPSSVYEKVHAMSFNPPFFWFSFLFTLLFKFFHLLM
jgi:hypothetical protein